MRWTARVKRTELSFANVEVETEDVNEAGQRRAMEEERRH
jgi:hypothetical protein